MGRSARRARHRHRRQRARLLGLSRLPAGVHRRVRAAGLAGHGQGRRRRAVPRPRAAHRAHQGADHRARAGARPRLRADPQLLRPAAGRARPAAAATAACCAPPASRRRACPTRSSPGTAGHDAAPLLHRRLLPELRRRGRPRASITSGRPAAVLDRTRLLSDVGRTAVRRRRAGRRHGGRRRGRRRRGRARALGAAGGGCRASTARSTGPGASITCSSTPASTCCRRRWSACATRRRSASTWAARRPRSISAP